MSHFHIKTSKNKLTFVYIQWISVLTRQQRAAWCCSFRGASDDTSEREEGSRWMWQTFASSVSLSQISTALRIPRYFKLSSNYFVFCCHCFTRSPTEKKKKKKIININISVDELNELFAVIPQMWLLVRSDRSSLGLSSSRMVWSGESDQQPTLQP